MGCALGGARHETVDCALSALSELSGPRAATVLGRKERLDILHASLLNGISSHVLDFDDNVVGSLENPLSDRDLETKFRGEADSVLSASEAQELLSLCWSVALLPDAAAIATASVPA